MDVRDYPKINNLDRALSPADQEWCFEAHPEISFLHWNGGVPLRHKKSTARGQAEREELIDGHWPGMREAALEFLQCKADRSHFTADDLNDAFACLWTARRIHDNEALRIPERPDVDARGLRMEIWY